jgi:hypothetical protein
VPDFSAENFQVHPEIKTVISSSSFAESTLLRKAVPLKKKVNRYGIHALRAGSQLF